MPSSSQKTLTVLDLYTAATPVWTVESIATRLACSTATAYRYVGDLCSAGLLTRVTGGSYVLGPRIVELDLLMREVDPIAAAGRPLIENLVAETGCDVLLSNVYGDHLVNVVHARGAENLPISFVRGRPHPRFRGAMAKAILAFMPRSQLVRIYKLHAAEIHAAGLGEDWLGFWRALQAIRQRGYSQSMGELDAGVVGLAAPVFNGPDVLGSVGLALTERRTKLLNVERLASMVVGCAARLSRGIEGISHPKTAVIRPQRSGSGSKRRSA
jgi:DNA-binding IclR family transcriptional regulator